MDVNKLIVRDKNEMDLSNRFWSKVNKRNINECWEWDGYIGLDGYGQFWYKGRTVHAHRVAWEIKNDRKIPNELIVLHSCDNKRCVNPYHLRVGTYSENLADTMDRTPYKMGRSSRFYSGEIFLMKKLHKAKISQRLIAKMFKTSQGHISNLVNNKRGNNCKYIKGEKYV